MACILSIPTLIHGQSRSSKRRTTLSKCWAINPSIQPFLSLVFKVTGRVQMNQFLPHIAASTLATTRPQALTKTFQPCMPQSYPPAPNGVSSSLVGGLASPSSWKKLSATTTSTRWGPFVSSKEILITTISSSLLNVWWYWHNPRDRFQLSALQQKAITA